MYKLKRTLDNNNYNNSKNDFDVIQNNYSISPNNSNIAHNRLVRSKKNLHIFNNLVRTINNNYNIAVTDPYINTFNKYIIPRTLIIKKEKIIINRDIDTLDDLLKLIEDYPITQNAEYNIDICKLHKIKSPLLELNNMIGIINIKNNILDQILFYLQDLHLSGGNDFMHTVLYGPPGTGKTEIAMIIGKIFSQLGMLNKQTFKKVTRSDLIAGYLGQTALKTTQVIKDSLGGVLFIDEAYALGNVEKRDIFAKECLDTLCEGLSNHKSNLMVIIAGYETELESCFFSYNQGLQSRFPWRFKIDNYTPDNLKNIFIKKITDISWTFSEDISLEFFEKNKENFKFYGRDMETLLLKTKIAHSKRIFCKSSGNKTFITYEDLENGYKLFKTHNKISNQTILNNMYT